MKKKGRNLRQELKQRPWTSAANWFAWQPMFSVLTYIAHANVPSEDTAAHSELVPSVAVRNQERAPQT